MRAFLSQCGENETPRTPMGEKNGKEKTEIQNIGRMFSWPRDSTENPIVLARSIFGRFCINTRFIDFDGITFLRHLCVPGVVLCSCSTLYFTSFTHSLTLCVRLCWILFDMLGSMYFKIHILFRNSPNGPGNAMFFCMLCRCEFRSTGNK